MPEVETVRVILPQSKVVKINVNIAGGASVPIGPQAPHSFYSGPPSGSTPGIPTFRLANSDDIAFAAILAKPNVFTKENTIAGIRVGRRAISSNYTLLPTDYELVVNATAGPILLSLPPALANGQTYRIKRLDASPNLITVQAAGTDTIDGAPSVTLVSQYDVVTLVDAEVGFWDKGIFIPPFVLPSNLAIKDQPNIFTDINTFTGIRVDTTTTSAAFFPLTNKNYELLVDASANNVSVQLPASGGSGQIYRVKKIDPSTNIVTIHAASGDLIDGAISVTLIDQYADAELVDADIGYWDNTGNISGGGGGGADFGVNGRVRDLFPTRGFAFDVFDGSNWIEQVRYTEPSGGPTPGASKLWLWRNDIISTVLLTAEATAGIYAEGSRLDCLFPEGIVGFVFLPDGASGAGQYNPDDYNAVTNNFHWEKKL